MVKEDILAFTAVLSSNMVTFWDTDLDNVAILIWFDAINAGCQKSTVNDFRSAMVAYTASTKGDFKPKPSNIIALMPDNNKGRNAWAVAERAVRTIGRTRTVEFQDPMITATLVHMGGWLEFCKSMDDEDQIRFVKKEFIQVYDSGICRPSNQLLLGSQETYNNKLSKVSHISIPCIKIKSCYLDHAPSALITVTGK